MARPGIVPMPGTGGENFAGLEIIPAPRSFLRFPDEIIPRLINPAARKFHLRFRRIFSSPPLSLPYFKPSLRQKEKCVWVVAVKRVAPGQGTPRGGSGCFQGFGFIWIIMDLSAGFCHTGSREAESLDLGLGIQEMPGFGCFRGREKSRDPKG